MINKKWVQAYEMLLKHRQELWQEVRNQEIYLEISGENRDSIHRLVARQKDEWDELQRKWEG